MIKNVIIILLLATQLVISQEEKTPWLKEKKLTWADFKGNPDTNNPFDAVTSSEISYRSSVKVINNKKEINYIVQSYFIPNKSWVIKKSLTNLDLLAHEQLHFDITELYARKFLQKLKKLRFTKNATAQIKTIYKHIITERKKNTRTI